MTVMVFWPPGGALALLAVRPSDKVAVVVASVVLMLVLGFFTLTPLQFAIFAPCVEINAGSVPPFLICALNALNFCSITPNLVCKGCGCDDRVKLPRVALLRLWRSFRIFCCVMVFFFLSIFLLSAGVLPPPTLAPNCTVPPVTDPRNAPDSGSAPGALTTAILLLLVGVGMKPAVRRRFHALLGSLAARGEAKAAAAVAGLVGGRSPAEALKHGTDTFRGVPFDSLSSNDFATSGDTGLHAKTVKATLGEVKAFLSHSW